MGMVIKSTIFPLRVSFKKKEKWDLLVEVENEDESDKKVSLRIELPLVASFGTVGTTSVYEKKFDKFRAKSKIELKFPVHMSNRAAEGSYFGKIRVEEHFNDYEHVERSYTKEIPFRIVE